MLFASLFIYTAAVYHHLPKEAWVLTSSAMLLCHLLGLLMGSIIKSDPVDHVTIEEVQ